MKPILSRRLLVRIAVGALAVLILTTFALAQRGGGGRRGGGGFGGGGQQNVPFDDRVKFAPKGEFQFLRLKYTDLPQYRRGFGNVSRRGQANGWWAQDWPDAEMFFSYGLQRLTRVDVAEPAQVGLLDGDQIFDYPWIYITQSGYMSLSDQEVLKLREFLQRGGFMMTDDMWGPNPEEWNNFEENMKRVFPDLAIEEMTEENSMMNVVYTIKDKDRTFIPGSRHLYRGQPQGTQPEWYTIHDAKHTMVAINYNTDIGDAWEFADAPEYPEAMTTLAYHYGINYLIYAMTH
ncbi:MAG: DUF4159 domain-containing protein [Acidobacteriota bacterium]